MRSTFGHAYGPAALPPLCAAAIVHDGHLSRVLALTSNGTLSPMRILWMLPILWFGSITQLSAQSAADVVLKPGDVVRIDVWRQPEFSGEFTLTPEGRIAHPLLQELDITGMSAPQIEAAVRSFLTEFVVNPVVVVEGLVRVSIGGEVVTPDVYLVPIGTDVARAIAMAGGLTRYGNPERVILRRDGVETRLNLETRTGLPEVRSGDQIAVLTNQNWLRQYGGTALHIAGIILGAYVTFFY